MRFETDWQTLNSDTLSRDEREEKINALFDKIFPHHKNASTCHLYNSKVQVKSKDEFLQIIPDDFREGYLQHRFEKRDESNKLIAPFQFNVYYLNKDLGLCLLLPLEQFDSELFAIENTSISMQSLSLTTIAKQADLLQRAGHKVYCYSWAYSESKQILDPACSSIRDVALEIKRLHAKAQNQESQDYANKLHLLLIDFYLWNKNKSVSSTLSLKYNLIQVYLHNLNAYPTLTNTDETNECIRTTQFLHTVGNNLDKLKEKEFEKIFDLNDIPRVKVTPDQDRFINTLNKINLFTTGCVLFTPIALTICLYNRKSLMSSVFQYGSFFSRYLFSRESGNNLLQNGSDNLRNTY